MQYRFLLFGYNEYEKCGGFGDFIFGFNSIDEFKEKIIKDNSKLDHYHIADLNTLETEQIYDEAEINGWYGDSSACAIELIKKTEKFFKKIEQNN